MLKDCRSHRVFVKWYIYMCRMQSKGLRDSVFLFPLKYNYLKYYMLSIFTFMRLISGKKKISLEMNGAMHFFFSKVNQEFLCNGMVDTSSEGNLRQRLEGRKINDLMNRDIDHKTRVTYLKLSVLLHQLFLKSCILLRISKINWNMPLFGSKKTKKKKRKNPIVIGQMLYLVSSP